MKILVAIGLAPLLTEHQEGIVLGSSTVDGQKKLKMS